MFRNLIGSAGKLIIGVGLLAASTAFGATTKIWVGSTDNFLLTAANWNPSGTPQANASDIMQWDGSQAGNLLLTNNQSGSFNNLDNSPGLFVNVTAGQTGSLTVVESSGGTGRIRLNSGGIFNVASGAGAVTFGNGSATDALGVVLAGSGNGAIHAFTNNSANTVTFGSEVYYLMGGGGAHTMLLAGTGNFAVNSRFQAQNSGSGLALTVGGSGTVSLGSASAPGIGYSGTYNNVTVNSGKLTLTAADALGTGNTLILNGGSLDSSVADLVNSGNNAQTWGGNFIFVGSQNLDLGSGNVSLTGNRTVTVSANTLTVGGVVSGGFSLAKAGAGTLLLNNANTYSGGTVVSNGVLKLGVSGAIPGSGSVTVHGTLDINGNSPTLINLSGAGIVDTVSGGAPILTISNGSSTTFSGMIKNTSGTLTMTKNGSGTLTLAGANTYSGATAVSAGTLLVNGSLGVGAVTVASGATLGGTNTIGGTVDWQSGSLALFTLTPTAAVIGSNATPLAVSGNVTLNGNSVTVNVAGGTPLAPGDYTLMTYNNTGSSGAFASGTPTFTGAGVQPGTASILSTSAGKVTLSVALTGVSSTWTNNGDGNWSAGANWSSNPTVPQAAGDGATLGVGSAYTTVALNTPVSLGVVNFTNANSFLISDSGNTLTFDNTGVGAAVAVTGGASNVIASAVALNDNLAIASGAGTSLAITNTISNTSGAKTLAVTGAGTVVLTANNTYGPSAGTVGTILGGGAVVQLANNNALGAGDVSVASSSTIRANTALTLANNIIASAGTASVDNNGNDVTLSGVISGSGALGKNGAGTLTLSSANSYSGDTAISAGAVKLGNASGIPGGVGKGNVNMGTNTTLDLNGFSAVLGGLNSTPASATVDNLAGGSVTLSLGGNGAFATFAGSIKNSSGTLALVKDGTGTETLTGTNTYTGGTTINVGTLQIGNGGTSGNLGSGTVANNGNLTFNLAATNIFAGQITGTGAVTLANASLNLWLTGNNATWTGPINFFGGNLWVTNTAGLGIGPKIIQPSNPNSTVHLDGSLGNLNVDSSISFNLSGTSGVLFNEAGSNTISGPVGLVFGNGNPYIKVNGGFLNLAGTVSAVNPRTLILGGAGDGLISDSFVDGGGAGALTKQDAGTWTLAGTGNNYSGATTVTGGTLIIDGTINGNGAIAVNGGTLLLNGTDNGTGAATIASGGTFGGVGIMYSPVTWQAGSTGKFSVSAGGETPMTIYNAVTLNNNAITVNVTGATPLPVGIYTLLNEPNVIYSIAGSFTNAPTITGAGLAAGTKAFVTTTTTAVKLTVVKSSVWTFNGNGNWTTGANWDSNPNYPNAAGQLAVLGVGSSLIAVNLNASQTIGGISFTNANSFVITNANNVLTLDNSGNGAQIGVTAGTANSIATGVSLNDATTVSASTGASLLIPGDVTGFAGLTLTGNGLLSLSGSNSYTGDTTLAGGTLVLGKTNAIGSGTLTISGGKLDSSVPNLANANNNAQNWNGSFTFLGSQNLALGSGGVALASGGATITVNGNTLTVGGAISGTGQLEKAGNGTLVLNGVNASLSGNVRIIGGTLALGDDSALGTGVLNLGNSSVDSALQTNILIRSVDATPRTFANNLVMNIFSPITFGGAGDMTFSGTVTCGSFQKIFAISNAVTTFSGTLIGGTSVDNANAKQGPGTLVLSGDNSTFAKRIEVNEGTLALGSATAIGTGALTMFGGGLDSTVADLVNTGNNAQRWNGSFYFAGSQNLNMGTGSVTMNANTTITVSNNTLTADGTVTGSGALTKAGTGKLVLSANSYTNNTTVSAGTLELGLANLATNSTVSVSNGAALQLDFAVTNQVAAFISNGVSQAAGVYKAANTGGLITGSGALLVVPLAPPINPNAPVMQVSVSGSTLSLAWPTNLGWTLQTNSVGLAATSQWFDYPGSAATTNVTIPVNPALPNVFFRMVYTNTP